MLKVGARCESLSLFSCDLAVGHLQQESVGIFPSILGVTRETHRRAVVHLLQIFLCFSAQFYLPLSPKGRGKNPKLLGERVAFLL